MHPNPELVVAFQQMADLTKPKCFECLRPYGCCSSEYCISTIDYAKERYGVVLDPTSHPTLPLMGPTGCIAAPHLRPLCTVHLCSIASMGRTNDAKFDDKYYELREQIDVLLWKEDEDAEAARD